MSAEKQERAGAGMTIGEKLKKARAAAGLTQSETAKGIVTRNMLSRIESGQALPSIPTLLALAARLKTSPGYFLTEEDSLLQSGLAAARPKLREAFRQKNYRLCIDFCDRYAQCGDEEVTLLLTKSYFLLGVSQLEAGEISAAAESLRCCRQLSASSLYGGGENEFAEFYLELLQSQKEGGALPSPFERLPSKRHFMELTLYVYLLNLINSGLAERAAAVYDTIRMESVFFRRHINARLSMAGANYGRACDLLREILREPLVGDEALFLETVLTDLENCCKATGDFAGAYECAAKRLEISKQ